MNVRTKSPSRRRLLQGALAAGAQACLPVVSSSARAAAPPIKIGFSAAKTGYLGEATPVAVQAYELWRDEVNASGGLKIAGSDPRQVEFVVYDDQSEPVKAAEAYEKLIVRDKVDLLLAPYGTPYHIAIGPVVERHKFPVIGTTCSSTLLRDMKARYMWFASPLTDGFATAIAGFLKAQGVTNASMLTLQLPASLETKKYMTPMLKSGGITTPVNVEYALSITDMTSMVASVKSARSQAVIGLTYPGDTVLYVNAAREANLDAPIQFLFVGPCTPFFARKFSKPIIDGIVTIGEWSANAKWKGAKEFFDAYSAKFKEPPDNLDSTICYASCQILQTAVAKAGLDKERLRETISSDAFETIKGPIKFSGAENKATVPGLLQIQDGQMQIIWPKEIATAPFRAKKGWA